MTTHHSQFKLPKNLHLAKKLAWLLDDAFTLPGVKQKIGLDPVLGLIPGGGDLVCFLLGIYILWVGYDVGVSQKQLRKMALNLLLDYLIGLIPIIGDAIDIMYRPNSDNIKIIEEHYHQKKQREGEDSGIVIEVEATVNR